MKRIITDYNFVASTKKITFPLETGFTIDGLLLITNVTDNIIIYNFADPLTGASVDISGLIITLTYNTTSMSDTDHLLIYHDDGLPAVNQITGEKGREASEVTSKEQMDMFTDILEELREIKLILASSFG